MDRVDPNGTCLDLEIDLESGGTSDEDASQKGEIFSSEVSLNLLGEVRKGFGSSESLFDPKKVADAVYPYHKLVTSVKNEEHINKMREDMATVIDNKTKNEKPKMHNPGKPSKPPRPPKGPSLDAFDIKLLKEISELNLKRKRMERIRTLKKKKERVAAPSLSSNLIACLVTITFILVIIFQGLLGPRV